MTPPDDEFAGDGPGSPKDEEKKLREGAEPEEIVDATVVEEGTDTGEGPESAPPEAAPGPAELALRTEDAGGGVLTLYGSSDPREITQHVANVATELKKILDKQELTTSMGGGREHVDVEGWQVCATLLGVQPQVVAVERTKPEREFQVQRKRKKWGKVDGKRVIVEETEDEWQAHGYSYRVWAEARTLDGRVVGKGIGFCSREEAKWLDADEYAVIGMASTRATSRTLRQVLAFVVAMAGYAVTPTGEMPDEARHDGPPFGVELQDEAKSREALAYLLDAGGQGPDEAAASKVWDQIVKDCADYMPAKVARGLLFAAAELKRKVEAGETPAATTDDGGGDSLPLAEKKED